MAVKMVLTGDVKLNIALANLANKLQRKFVRQAARYALKTVVKTARQLAPKKTGRLRKSIKVKSIKRSRSRIGSRVTTGAADNQFTGESFYGAFIEFGWKTGRRTSATRKRIEGQHFLKLAAQRKKRAAIARYRTKLRQLIEQETRSAV